MSTRFRFRDIAFVAFGPSVVNSIGHGAVMPMLALRARDLGADVPTAALVTAMLPLGMMLASLPAGALIARIGERRGLLLAGLVDVVAMLVAASAHAVWLLGAAMVVSGCTWTVFLLARQGFMIDAVPESHRARGMSLLGGTFRIGVLIGPLIGALLIARWGLASAFVLGAAMSAVSALIAVRMPDLGAAERRAEATDGHRSVLSVLRAHRRPLLTLGLAVVVISASRSVRLSLLPLWCDHLGLSPTTTSLLFALAAFVDVLFFFPGGWLMDHRGRMAVALPVVLSSAVACLLLPLTTGAATVAAVAVLMAAGNGLGSGIVLTLGADTAPIAGRSQYLGGWRMLAESGQLGGPALVAAVAALAPLAVAAVVIGSLTMVGAAWTGYWTRELDHRRLGRLNRTRRLNR